MVLEGTIAFIFGLVYGSFLNVVILRLDEWKTILYDRSHCPNCKNDLMWYDLIPVISYASLGGKCRYCKKPISGQYPMVEILTAVLVTLGYFLVFTSNWPLWREIVAFALLILALGSIMTILWQDLREMMIPDSISYALLFFAILFSWAFTGDFLKTIYGGLVGFLPIALLVYPSRGKWMGEGDVKLATALGLLVGFPSAAVFMVMAFFSGGLYGAIALIAKKAKLKTAVPFAPFLIFGALIALFWGKDLVNWYLAFALGQ